MKKTLTVLMFAILSCGFIQAQDFADIDKSVMDAAYYPAKATFRAFAKTDAEKAELEPRIRVLYSRPLKKEREIFGGLVKFDEPWRLGANESTEILFMTDVKIGDGIVKAGRYSMHVIPTKDKWTININSEVDSWGSYSYNADNDVASVVVTTQKSDKVIEAVSIALYEKSENTVHLKIGWDDTIAELPIMLK